MRPRPNQNGKIDVEDMLMMTLLVMTLHHRCADRSQQEGGKLNVLGRITVSNELDPEAVLSVGGLNLMRDLEKTIQQLPEAIHLAFEGETCRECGVEDGMPT